ncbi:primosomal protein DnaI [Paenibacillus tarimensis]|uniref:primosomal protein DnaI n=1 Tax=Paenibacillus tarimensis TaxID=416012 RepID=UPI001F3EF4FA|nr:primosomal protein DnaI [Paenibacillus tarimensis]MCF2943790.1 primosomal protein DnaI [Paenibacillus tarimensis]
MESLGEVLKQWPGGRNMQADADRLYTELMAEPLVRQFRSRHPELDTREYRINLNRVYHYVKEQRACAECPGLDRCPNDFEGHYTMLECVDSGGGLQLIDRKAPCSKLIARQNEQTIKRKVRSFYVDEASLHRGYSADEIMNADPERMLAVGRTFSYIKQTKERGLQPKGLYLVGHFGTGKTFLMCYMLHELAKVGYSGVIVYMPEFVEDLKSMLDEPAKLRETVEIMKETDLLVFDDIGAENLNPWARDHVMGAILNYRMNRKPTFYTSNHDLDALERHFSFTNKDGDEAHKGQRLMDRIRPYVDKVWVNGENKRGLY